MAVKISLTDIAQKIRIVKSNLDPKQTWYCIDMTSGGSPAAPKGLPKASVVNYTVIFSDRQYKKLETESAAYGLKVKGSKILVQGEITLDIPLNIVTGEIGVIPFQVKNLNVEHLKREAEAAAAADEQPQEQA